MCVIAVSISLCLTAAVLWYFVQSTPSSNKTTTIIKKRDPTVKGQTIDITYIRDEVIRLWNLPFSSLPVCVDLARLASRVSIIDLRSVSYSSSAALGEYLQFGPIQHDEMDALEKTSFIISTVANFVEKDEMMKEKIKRIVYAKRGTDSQFWLEKVFEEIGGESNTAQLFKLVNQTIIQPVCTSVKKMIFELIHSIPTDVRTSDGWKVIISFHKDNLSVTHIRKEEIRGQFSFSWSLSILLNYDLMSLQDVTLTFSSMTYEENFPKHLKEQLNKYLGIT